MSEGDILAEYPQLTIADIRACLAYASTLVDENLPPRLVAWLAQKGYE